MNGVKGMAAIIRILFRFLLVILAFLGGWFSSEYVRQDPFLASLLPSSSSPSDVSTRLIDHLNALIGKTGTDPGKGSEGEPIGKTNNAGVNPQEGTNWSVPSVQEGSAGGATASQDKGIDPVSPGADVFNLNGMIETLNTGLTAKEKLSFLLWAKSKFNEAEMKEVTALIEGGLTQENFVRLFEKVKDKLRPEDYAYLLSLMDRYVTLKEEKSLPVFEPDGAKERKAYAQ